MKSLSNSTLIRIISLVMALLWVVLLSYTLPVQEQIPSGEEALGFSWHAFLIATEDPMYPANIPVLMWISFFYCIGELLSKWSNVREEQWMIDRFDLYNDPKRVMLNSGAIELEQGEALKPEILAAIYYAKRDGLRVDSLIGELFKTINFQFQSTNDVGDVYSAVTAAVELRLHEVDLRYTVVRYLAWLIPTLGFIGTVIGIAIALGKAGVLGGDDPDLLIKVIPLLATAFYTTLLALLLSAVLMIFLQLIQAQDEESVNRVGRFCLENIVTNLKPRSGG